MKLAQLRPVPPTARTVFGAIVVKSLSTAEVRVASRFVHVRRSALVGGGGR